MTGKSRVLLDMHEARKLHWHVKKGKKKGLECSMHARIHGIACDRDILTMFDDNLLGLMP